MSKRNPKLLGEWGPGKPRVRASAKAWREVEKWDKRADRARVEKLHSWPAGKPMPIERPRVFCASMADWLDDADVVMPDGRIDRRGIETLADLLDLWRRCENLDFLALTKRVENWTRRIDMAQMYAASEGRFDLSDWLARWMNNTPPPNVWIGTSAENQEYWDKRVPVLLNIPARVRFVSVEPMLSAIDMRPHLWNPCDRTTFEPTGARGIDWVIFGGESGSKARPCSVDWIRDGVRQCREAGVKAFVKQLGACSFADRDDLNMPVVKVSYTLHPFDRKKEACFFGFKDRKGADMAEWSSDLRVRQWPEGGANGR